MTDNVIAEKLKQIPNTTLTGSRAVKPFITLSYGHPVTLGIQFVMRRMQITVEGLKPALQHTGVHDKIGRIFYTYKERNKWHYYSATRSCIL